MEILYVNALSNNLYTHSFGDRYCCQSCMARIPYATLVATVMCLLGVGIFGGTMYRGASLNIIMMDQDFHLRLIWIEAIQMASVIIAAATAALGFTILFVGFLATDAIRHKVYRYRAWRSRVGGRISCAVLMGLTYLLNFIWTLILCFLVISTFVYTMFFNMCSRVDYLGCISLTQFHFMFPYDTKLEDMQICGRDEIIAYCKDGVDIAELMFILALASLLVILSLVHYLMCLSANYAHTRDQKNSKNILFQICRQN